MRRLLRSSTLGCLLLLVMQGPIQGQEDRWTLHGSDSILAGVGAVAAMLSISWDNELPRDNYGTRIDLEDLFELELRKAGIAVATDDLNAIPPSELNLLHLTMTGVTP